MMVVLLLRLFHCLLLCVGGFAVGLCDVVLDVILSFAIILLGKRELLPLLHSVIAV